jgi:sigma-B regulation protein RsbU (phosphoserine phosphatase)
MKEESPRRSIFKRIKLRPKMLIALAMLSIVLIVVITSVVAIVYRENMEKRYSDMAFQTATIAANLIDGDQIARYRQTGEKDEYYETVRQRLQMIRSTTGVKYLYVVIPEDVQYYIWDTGDEGDEGVCDLGDTDEFYGGGDVVMHGAFQANAEQTMLITNDDVYGYLASAYVAVLDSKGEPAALASVDVSLDEINRQLRNYYLWILGLSVAVVLVAGILYYFYIKRILIKPIHTLDEDARMLVSDQITNLSEFKNRVHTGDELESLGETFEHMTRELDEYIRNLAAVTKEKERIGAELNVATQIQADMLPRIFPAFPDRNEFDLYATMDPAKEVGGDFYDFFLVDDDHIALVMADVSGKGVPAALFMVIAKTLIKNRTLMGGGPSEILADVNSQLCEGNEAELFVTVWLAIIEISTGKGLAANAGHEHPALRHSGGEFELVEYRHSPAVATIDGIRFRQHDFQLNPGDSLYVYTDGVAEATDIHNELYGSERMIRALNKTPEATPKELLKIVREDIDAFVGEAPQFDDITMLNFVYKGKE